MTSKIDYSGICKAHKLYINTLNNCPYIIVEEALLFCQGFLTLIKARKNRWGSSEKYVRILSLAKL